MLFRSTVTLEERRAMEEAQRARDRAALAAVRSAQAQPAMPRPTVVPTITPVEQQQPSPTTSGSGSQTQSTENPTPATATPAGPISSTAVPSITRMNETFTNMLAALDNNNSIGSEQREILNDLESAFTSCPRGICQRHDSDVDFQQISNFLFFIPFNVLPIFKIQIGLFVANH